MTAPPRFPDWPERLSEYVEARRAKPFAWGDNDCVAFASGAVRAITGWLPPLPSWRTQEEAHAALRAEGGLRRALDRRLQRIPVPQAQRGDVVLVPQPGGPLLALCVGAVCCAPSARGLVFEATLAARFAWRV